MSDLGGNSEDRVSNDAAHMTFSLLTFLATHHHILNIFFDLIARTFHSVQVHNCPVSCLDYLLNYLRLYSPHHEKACFQCLTNTK